MVNSRNIFPSLLSGTTVALVMHTLPASALDINQTVVDTVSAHPLVKEKVHVYRQTISDETIAKSGWRPSVDLQASTGLYETESPSTNNDSVDYDSTQVEFSVTQNLFNGYDTSHQIKQTRARAEAALYDVFDVADNIALDVIQAYFEVLKQRRLFQLATENVMSHEDILAQIRERNSSGVGRRSQLQQTEGRVARAHASLVAQLNNLQDSLTAFHQLLGRYIEADQLVEPDLPAIPESSLDDLIDQALLHHPAMQVAMSNVEASMHEYRRSKKGRYPNLDLRLASEWGEDIGGIEGDTKELSLTLNLTYNFYDGGLTSAQSQKSISVVHEQKQFAARVRRQIINALRLAWVADQSLATQLSFLKQHIVKAKETSESYREEFFIGQRDLIDLLDAENELNSAHNDYTQAYYDALAARYRVYEAGGLLFDALQIAADMSDDRFTVARIDTAETDELPLSEDDDEDQEKDREDHCDNSLPQAMVNAYGCESPGTVDLSYSIENTIPLAGADHIDVEANSVLVISQARLLENDIDNDGHQLEIVDFQRPNRGRLAYDKNKNLVYRPAEGFSGIDRFIYTVSDGAGGTARATVELNVFEPSTIDMASMQYVNFEYDSVELTEVSKEKVIEIIDAIRKAKDIRVEVYTHTDNIGSDRFNIELSDRRAEALKQLLLDNGLDNAKIEATGMGERSPIADNETKAGQAINRRGEFVFKALEITQ